MRRADFEKMIRDMSRELPPDFLDGVEAIDVTSHTIPDPVHKDVYTLGECVPRVFGEGDEGAKLRSHILLHHGSFQALSRIATGFDWRHEAWETLTHELRHHLEWRARVQALEAFDDAVDANYRRLDGKDFPPLFHLDGDAVAPGVTKVEDDVFIDVMLSAGALEAAAGKPREFTWHGSRYTVPLPAPLPDILFLTIDGVEPQPAGDLVLVLRRRPGARDLWHRAVVKQDDATATPAPAP